jgi:cell division septation protein DedD
MKLYRILLLLALGLFLSNVAMAQPALKRANKNYELSEFSKAIQDYKEVLSKTPNHLEANCKIADSYRHLNQQDRALPHYQAAVSTTGVENMYVFQYGLTLMELGQYDIARRVFEKLASDSPDFRTRALNFAEACQYAVNNLDPPLFKVANEYVNTLSSDFGPTLLGDRVVYASSRTDIITRNSRNAPASGTGANRLFISQRDKNGFLEVPVTLHSGLANATNEGPVAYSADGKWVAITKNNFTDGTRMMPSSGLSLTLYIAQTGENGDWTNTVPFPHNGTDFSTGFPSFSSDGKALFFASDRPGSYGGFDLYVSYRAGNTWSAPENLGTTVNSIGNEITPFYDGTSLYFASDYHRGFGGFDIFRAEESSGRWASIFHGGPGLNSSVDDYGFVYDASRNVGYFVSNRPGGKGGEDIYRIQKETENIVIKVTDAITGVAISDAAIDFTNCGDKTYQTDVNGIFNFQLMENLNCAVTIKKDGFLSKTVKITSLGLRQSRTLDVQLAKTGESYRGKVVNGSNGYVLEGVKIIATNQATSESTTATTDGLGDYLIPLQSSATYVLRYSKAGYRDLSFNFKTGANDSKAIQNIEMLPVGVAATATPPPAAKQPVNETPTSFSSEPASTTMMGGYAVQLAAASSPNVDLRPYQTKVGDLGAVYSVEEGGKTKIRVGVFNTRDEAAAVQAKVKAQGYSGAFVVEEKTRQAKSTTVAAAKSTPETKTAASTAGATKLEGYMVRLGVFRDASRFNQGLVDDVGIITYVPKGDLTIVLLTGYDSRSSAEIGLRKARNRGFPDAFIVEMKGGELKKAE